MQYEVKIDPSARLDSYIGMIHTIEAAAATGYEVDIAYTDVSDKRSIRRIKPVKVEITNGYKVILTAIDLGVNEPRHFLFNRIFWLSIGKNKITETVQEVAVRCFRAKLESIGVDVSKYTFNHQSSQDGSDSFIDLTAVHVDDLCTFSANTSGNEYREDTDDIPIWSFDLEVY